jgi:ketosteroid isomerase-like protein
MNESWNVRSVEAVTEGQAVWDALVRGDPMPALEGIADGVIIDNGPGAGPWRHVEGKDAFLDMALNFPAIFGDTWKQVGTCIFANDQFAITLVAETGVHARSGDVFDNRAIWISRFDADGKSERVWTVDLDHEALEAFWDRNPVRP